MRFVFRDSSVRRFTRYFPIAAAVLAAWIAQPHAALGHGAWHEKIEKLRALLVVQPDEARLHLEIADVFVRHGDWLEALAHLDRIDALEPGEFDLRLLRGQALVGAARMGAARAVLDDFLKSAPQHPVALTARARALAELGEEEACLADYRAAIGATPDPEPDLFREVAEALGKRQRLDEAVSVLRSGLAKLGDVPALLTAAMQLEIATGRVDDAIGRVDTLRRQAPRPEPWMAKRAEILTRAGRHDDARAAWQALLDHIATLPNLDRGSPSMAALAAQAQQAVQALSHSPTTTAQRSSP